MGWILYFIFLFGLMYFIAFRPQKKEKKRHEELMASIAVGDTVLTSSGFYGVIIDMTDDTVIVEFGDRAGGKTGVGREQRRKPWAQLGAAMAFLLQPG